MGWVGGGKGVEGGGGGCVVGLVMRWGVGVVGGVVGWGMGKSGVVWLGCVGYGVGGRVWGMLEWVEGGWVH